MAEFATTAYRAPVDVPLDSTRWAEVDLGALRENVRHIVSAVAPARFLMVAKADGYGHGSVPVVHAAVEAGAWGAAVSTVPEAARLRASGFQQPILVFGAVAAGEEDPAVRLRLAVTVYDAGTAGRLEMAARRQQRALAVHLKVDTGMSRLGCMPDEAPALARRLAGSEWLRWEGVYTHLASAGENRDSAREQLRVFEEVRRVLARQGTLPEFVHAANSAATLDLPESWLEGVRVGLAAYGISPLPPEVPAPMPLRPALSWRARVAQVKDLPAGAAVGYGGTFTCPAPMRVAAATIGYADGYPRALSNRASVLIRGARCPVLGRVSMDLITVDCATVPEAEPGDIVTLLGRDGDDEISAWELAVRAGTIPYEITCGLSPRVPRTYPE